MTDEHVTNHMTTNLSRGVAVATWAPDGESIASGSADGTIRIWNGTSGAQVHVQRVQITECKVNTIAWSHDGTRLVTGAEPGGLQVWDIVVGKELKGKLSIPGVKTMLAMTKNLERAIDRTAERTLRLWDIGCENGKILKELSVRFSVSAAVFLHNDTLIAFCGDDGAVHVWDLESGECTPKVELESKVTESGMTYIYGITLSQDRNTLALSTLDRIHFFNTKSWDSLGSFRGYFNRTASFSPDGRRLLTSYNSIDMWDSSSVLAPKPQTTSPTPSSPPIVKHDSHIYFVGISIDGSRVAAASGEAVSIWSLESASLLCIIRGDILGNVVFSSDAQKIAVREYDETCIWDISTNQPALVQSISTANEADDRIAWSPNGHWIAGPAYGPNITRGVGVFDAVTGELMKHLALTNMGILWDLEFSPDNTMLYAWYETDETIFRWKEEEKVDLEKHRWETERDRRNHFHKDGWIIRERDKKRLCWVQEGYRDSVVRWGNYYAVGRNSGQLDILHIEESSVDTT